MLSVLNEAPPSIIFVFVKICPIQCLFLTQIYTIHVLSCVCKLCNYICRSVVLNYRGCGNTGLSTPVLYCVGKVDDIMEAIGHIKQRYPKSPLMTVGTSFGGYALHRKLYVCSTDTVKSLGTSHF